MVECTRGFRHPEAGSVTHYAQLGAECRPEAVRGVGHKFTARTVLFSLFWKLLILIRGQK